MNFGRRDRSHFDGKANSQSADRNPLVFMLTAPFRRRTGNSRRPMNQLDRRFDLVSMLPTRPRMAKSTYLAVVEQVAVGRKDRMTRNVAVAL
jgi:hypothetical protein